MQDGVVKCHIFEWRVFCDSVLTHSLRRNFVLQAHGSFRSILLRVEFVYEHSFILLYGSFSM